VLDAGHDLGARWVRTIAYVGELGVREINRESEAPHRTTSIPCPFGPYWYGVAALRWPDWNPTYQCAPARAQKGLFLNTYRHHQLAWLRTQRDRLACGALRAEIERQIRELEAQLVRDEHWSGVIEGGR
jgi:hypothetical protein